jgi:tetratricopeptide (TPR) repeat protein
MSLESELALESGKSYFEAGKTKEALQAFDKAVRLEPGNGLYHAWLARACNWERDYTRALLEANIAKELAPSCALAYLARSNAYKSGLLDISMAVADFQTAMTLDPLLQNDYAKFGHLSFVKQEFDFSQANR